MAVKKETAKKPENFILINFDKAGDVHLSARNVTDMQQIQAMLLLMEGMRETLLDKSLHTAIDAITAYKNTSSYVPVALGKKPLSRKKVTKKPTKKVAKKK